ALAEAALSRGAEVSIVAGTTSVDSPHGVRVARALSAEEMHEGVMKELPRATVFISAAAVADYRPSQRAATKIKKNVPSLVLTLEQTRDILAEVASARTNGLLVIGFAAETNDVLINAREKLLAKNLDAIVANDVSRGDVGFDSSENSITILSRDGQDPLELPRMSKLDAAHRVLDEIVRLRAKSKISADVRL
ncbi:MAG: phosphopantothenoylcysteine decarboxylase, partial [Pyrinomonadaceae bacterium]